MEQSVLITGGTGTVGQRLTFWLQQAGYRVSYLTRDLHQPAPAGVRLWHWQPRDYQMDAEALKDVDHIIHLAGAGIADQRWTEDRKHVILKSRTQTAALLNHYLQKTPNRVKSFISASGISRYGLDTGDRWLQEDDAPADDFVARVVVAWENEAQQIAALGYRVAALRLGVVLSPKGGALEKLATPVKLWVGAPLGDGRQYVSWVHLDDVCQAFIFALQNETITGAYHIAAPNPVTNAVLTQKIAKVLGKPLLAPNVPAFALKFILGDMADLVLGSNRVSSEKIRQAGFSFTYTQVEKALQDLLNK